MPKEPTAESAKGRPSEDDAGIKVFQRAWDHSAKQNALPVWYAYARAREAGRDVPQWVLEYFDLCLQEIDRLTKVTPAPSAADIAEALKLKPASGRGSRSFFAEKPLLCLYYGYLVAEEVKNGSQETYAIEHVAKESAEKDIALSPATVRRYYKRYIKMYPDGFASFVS